MKIPELSQKIGIVMGRKRRKGKVLTLPDKNKEKCRGTMNKIITLFV